MVGLGYRRTMRRWDMNEIKADFFEVSPENWVRRDIAPLQALVNSNRPIFFHGVSLNLGGTQKISRTFLGQISSLMRSLNVEHYSDHLSASGDAHQLYDLFPIPFTEKESHRVADRIKFVQDTLGCRIGIENPTWYTNIGDMSEPEFLAMTADLADCNILLDLNNIDVNFKNHGKVTLDKFLSYIDFERVSYMHVAGHEYDHRFDLFVDTHSQAVEDHIITCAKALQKQHQLPILLEWDNDIPEPERMNKEILCLNSTAI